MYINNFLGPKPNLPLSPDPDPKPGVPDDNDFSKAWGPELGLVLSAAPERGVSVCVCV